MLSPEYWSAISTLPTIIMMAPSSGAGRTCCGTSTTSEPATPKTPHWPDGAAAVPPTLCRSQSLQPSRAWQRRVAQLAWERKLLAICRPFLSDPSCPGAGASRQGAEPDVPADNNPAGAACAIWFMRSAAATRSGAGHRAQDDAGSLFGTWRAQGLNPLAACRQLL